MSSSSICTSPVHFLFIKGKLFWDHITSAKYIFTRSIKAQFRSFSSNVNYFSPHIESDAKVHKFCHDIQYTVQKVTFFMAAKCGNTFMLCLTPLLSLFLRQTDRQRILFSIQASPPPRTGRPAARHQTQWPQSPKAQTSSRRHPSILARSTSWYNIDRVRWLEKWAVVASVWQLHPPLHTSPALCKQDTSGKFSLMKTTTQRGASHSTSHAWISAVNLWVKTTLTWIGSWLDVTPTGRLPLINRWVGGYLTEKNFRNRCHCG